MPKSARRHSGTRARTRAIGILLRTAQWISPSLAARILARLFLATGRHERPARERDWLRTATPTSFRSRERGLRAWVWPADGPSVLLAHGWEGRGAQLGAFVGPLLAAGYRVVTFDAPGHGISPGRSSSLVEMADAVLDAGRELGPFDFVVAHSAGAAATTLALSRGLPAKRLVYLAPPADLGEFLDFVAARLRVSSATVSRTREILERRFGVGFQELVHVRLARKMSHPLLLLHDSEDREIPVAYSRKLASSWLGSRLEVTRGLGHRRILRDERIVSRAVSFLSDGHTYEETSLPTDSGLTDASTTRSLPSCLAR